MKLQGRLTVVALLFIICFASSLDENALKRRVWNVPVQPVTLYFGQSDAMGVSAEIRWLAPEDITPVRLVEAIIEGPRDPRLVPSVPRSTQLNSARRQDDRIVLDFTDSIVTHHPGGSAGEIMTVYSVVNTLTELGDVHSVVWLIEGDPVDTLVGHLDLSRPVLRSEYAIVSP